MTLRSSRGGEHKVVFPQGVEMESLSINGVKQTLQQKEDSVVIPVKAGKQKIQINWAQKEGVQTWFQTPMFNLGIPSVNSSIEVNMPGRWVFFLGGPPMGPAVLFWGELFVILMVAFGLGKLSITPLKPIHWILLALGSISIGIEGSVVLVLWFLTIGFRKRYCSEWKPIGFDLFQLFLAVYTLAVFGIIYQAISNGLLGQPDMVISGLKSYGSHFYWYQERSAAALPTSWVFSLPVVTYRIAMLAWALWFAFNLLKWLRWAWDAYSEEGIWKKIRSKIIKEEKSLKEAK